MVKYLLMFFLMGCASNPCEIQGFVGRRAVKVNAANITDITGTYYNPDRRYFYGMSRHTKKITYNPKMPPIIMYDVTRYRFPVSQYGDFKVCKGIK